MSDSNPTDAAIEALRERERQLEIEIQMLTARRDEVRELLALLASRRPRAPRKPRPANGDPADAVVPATGFAFSVPAAEVLQA